MLRKKIEKNKHKKINKKKLSELELLQKSLEKKGHVNSRYYLSVIKRIDNFYSSRF